MALQRRKRSNPEADFQMAPMIDMVFLLLVFFMCVSTMAQAEKKELNLPESEQSKVAENLADRGIVSIDAEGLIYVNASVVTLAQMQERIQKAVAENAELRIQVRADQETAYEDIKRVLKACAEAGAHEVIYATYQAR